MGILFLLLCVLGIIFLIVAITIQYTFVKKVKLCTTCVKAEIVDMCIEKSEMNTGINTDRHYMQSYYPIFQYTYKDKEYTTKSIVGYGKGREAIGDTQEIWINPDNPEQIFRKSTTWQHLFYLFLFVGVGILVIAVVFYNVVGQYF